MAPENICLKTCAASFHHRPFPAVRDLNVTEVDGKCQFVVDNSSSSSKSYIALFMPKRCSEFLTDINSFNPHNSPMRWILLSSACCPFMTERTETD